MWYHSCDTKYYCIMLTINWWDKLWFVSSQGYFWFRVHCRKGSDPRGSMERKPYSLRVSCDYMRWIVSSVTFWYRWLSKTTPEVQQLGKTCGQIFTTVDLSITVSVCRVCGTSSFSPSVRTYFVVTSVLEVFGICSLWVL